GDAERGLQQVEADPEAAAVDEVAGQGGHGPAGGGRGPLGVAAEEGREQGQGAEDPPQEPVGQPPAEGAGDVLAEAAEQQPVGDADGDPDGQVDGDPGQRPVGAGEALGDLGHGPAKHQLADDGAAEQPGHGPAQGRRQHAAAGGGTAVGAQVLGGQQRGETVEQGAGHGGQGGQQRPAAQAGGAGPGLGPRPGPPL